MSEHVHKYAERFRGFLPVVVDIETGGFDSEGDALLEIAAVIVRMDERGLVHPDPVISTHVEPFPGANIDPKSLEITGIDVTHPFRAAVEERAALDHIFIADSPARCANTIVSARFWSGTMPRSTFRS